MLGAFSPDAVPVRLLSREAIRLDPAKPVHHGLLAFNPASYLAPGGRRLAPPSRRG
ncbi:hypothetical protein [Aquisphaera insulae]|uniref:hypothetical protein n=1 Tax=Aquisphaera insulae TaxID=2712864 RepID=UPI0013EB633E|nr:hypothetical protein [Aquisphaera insulae]